MTWYNWTRQSHRWVSMIFTAVAAAIFAGRGMGATIAGWVYFLPLIPLALLALTGLIMFFLPYVARGRHRDRSGSGAAPWPAPGRVR